MSATPERSASDDDASWQQIGAHRFRLEPPDLAIFQMIGDVSPDEVLAMFEVIARFAGDAGRRVFCINDASRLGDLPAESRKSTVNSGILAHARGLAVVGAGFHQRILAKLVIGAARLGMRPGTVPPTAFFPTEQEARDWIARLRRVA